MRQSMKILISVFLLMALTLSVIAGSSVFGPFFPAEFTTITTTSVNFSTYFNQTSTDATAFKLLLMNSSDSSSDRTYSLLASANITNATFWNKTITMVNDKRIWFFYNVTNGSSTRDAVLSDVRIFDVDTGFLKFRFGGYDALNFTLDKGNIVVANNITLTHPILRNRTTVPTCTAGAAGAIMFNNSFYGCDGTNWIKLVDESNT